MFNNVYGLELLFHALLSVSWEEKIASEVGAAGSSFLRCTITAMLQKMQDIARTHGSVVGAENENRAGWLASFWTSRQ